MLPTKPGPKTPFDREEDRRKCTKCGEWHPVTKFAKVSKVGSGADWTPSRRGYTCAECRNVRAVKAAYRKEKAAAAKVAAE